MRRPNRGRMGGAFGAGPICRGRGG